MYTREDIIEKVREERVKFIRMQFTDVFGVLKNIALTSEDLLRALAGRVSLDSSAVDGVIGRQVRDINLLPDLSTFVILPWRPREGAVARFICDVTGADGSPYPGCSRTVLKSVLGEVARAGLKVLVGAEVEFYLFYTGENSNPTTDAHDRAGLCDLTPVDLGENARRDMVLTMEEMGFDVGYSHHAAGPGQHKISLKPGNALEIADRLATFRLIVRSIAQRHGLHASLMPKPLNGAPGSALHLHLYLHPQEEESFSNEEQPLCPGREFDCFIGGVLAHTRANTAITNPLINSYKRLTTGNPAPRYIAWSEDSRDSVLRVLTHQRQKKGVEVRNPDPACNPYLTIAVILKAGLYGIEQQLSLPPPLSENTRRANDIRGRGVQAECLPRTLEEALRELASNQLARNTLGDHIYQGFVRGKTEELERFMSFVHPWELKEYFDFF